MKASLENLNMMISKITDIQKDMSKLQTLIDHCLSDLNEHERHNVKAVKKANGWLINLKADLKRKRKDLTTKGQ